jgi:hypothetical protein
MLSRRCQANDILSSPVASRQIRLKIQRDDRVTTRLKGIRTERGTSAFAHPALNKIAGTRPPRSKVVLVFSTMALTATRNRRGVLAAS